MKSLSPVFAEDFEILLPATAVAVGGGGGGAAALSGSEELALHLRVFDWDRIGRVSQ